MGRFLNGVLVDSEIGLLVAPMKGEEMRPLVSERYGDVASTTKQAATSMRQSGTTSDQGAESRLALWMTWILMQVVQPVFRIQGK